MFRSLFSSTQNHTTSTTHPKPSNEKKDIPKSRSWYFTAPNPSNGQKYTTTTIPVTHSGSQQPLAIVVGRKGNVEIVTAHGHNQSQGQGHANTAKHHTTNSGSLPNAVLVSPAHQSSQTKRHEKHTSAPPPQTLRKVVSNDDRSKAVNNRHSIIGVQRVRSREHVQTNGPRSDVATTGGTIAPRTVSTEKPRAQSHSHSHSHRATGDPDDSKQYPKSPYPAKKPLPSSRRAESPEDYYHHSERHAEGHHSSKHHSSSHQLHSHDDRRDHHRHLSDSHHRSSGKENIPSRTTHAVRGSHSNLENLLSLHSQSFLQAPSRSQPQQQSQQQSRRRGHSPSRPRSAEKHVRYLDPTHPEIIPDRTPLRPITAQPYASSAPAASAPIGYERSRRNSMPTQPAVYFGEPRLSHSYQSGYDIHTLRFPKPHGWFNQRGDQYIAKGLIKKQPLEMQWHPMFASYPEVGRGWMDEERKFLPASGGILKN